MRNTLATSHHCKAFFKLYSTFTPNASLIYFGISVGGPATITSAPIFCKRYILLMATLLCMMSPIMATFNPANCPSFSCIEKASNKAWVGCSLIPSPALTMAAGICLAKKCGAPEALWRITTKSTFILKILLTVSSSVSPFAADELLAAKFKTSADNLRSANSNDILVRVEFS